MWGGDSYKQDTGQTLIRWLGGFMEGIYKSCHIWLVGTRHKVQKKRVFETRRMEKASVIGPALRYGRRGKVKRTGTHGQGKTEGKGVYLKQEDSKR